MTVSPYTDNRQLDKDKLLVSPYTDNRQLDKDKLLVSPYMDNRQLDKDKLYHHRLDNRKHRSTGTEGYDLGTRRPTI